MPTLDTLERFIALVEAGAGLAPIEQFYTDDAVMQQNEQPPRVGKTALLEHEARAAACGPRPREGRAAGAARWRYRGHPLDV